MTHSILTRWMFETGHDGRPRGMSGNRRMGRSQPTWLNSTIRLVRRLVEVVKPISGLRNIGMAHLLSSKAGSLPVLKPRLMLVLPAVCFEVIAPAWFECFGLRLPMT